MISVVSLCAGLGLIVPGTIGFWRVRVRDDRGEPFPLGSLNLGHVGSILLPEFRGSTERVRLVSDWRDVSSLEWALAQTRTVEDDTSGMYVQKNGTSEDSREILLLDRRGQVMDSLKWYRPSLLAQLQGRREWIQRVGESRAYLVQGALEEWLQGSARKNALLWVSYWPVNPTLERGPALRPDPHPGEAAVDAFRTRPQETVLCLGTEVRVRSGAGWEKEAQDAAVARLMDAVRLIQKEDPGATYWWTGRHDGDAMCFYMRVYTRPGLEKEILAELSHSLQSSGISATIETDSSPVRIGVLSSGVED